MKVIIDGSKPGLPNVHTVIGALKGYGFSRNSIGMMLKLAAEEPSIAKEWKIDGFGWVTIRYHGLSRFTLEEHSGKLPGKVAKVHPRAYTSREAKANAQRKESTMPARARKAPTGPASLTELDEDLPELDRPLTPTNKDYVTWFTANVANPADIEPDSLLVAGLHFYGFFQRSKFNKEQKEIRREAHAAGNGGPESDEADEKPARRGRPKAAASEPVEPDEPPVKPARRGRPKAAASETPEPPARPARRRGRPASATADF